MPEATSPRVRDFAAARRFSTATLDRWLRLDPNDQAALLHLAERLRLGENQFRDFFDWSEEIAVRDRCSIAAVWSRPPLAAALARDLGRNQAMAVVKAALRQVRFPQLAAVEAKLAELARQLKLPRSVRIVFPEHLEGDEVRLEMTARSAAALRDTAAALQRALEGAALNEMFRTLREAP